MTNSGTCKITVVSVGKQDWYQNYSLLGYDVMCHQPNYMASQPIRPQYSHMREL
jgi:hypothetical protein